MKRILFLVTLFDILFTGCRDDMPDMQNPRTDDDIYNWAQFFESYWSGMNYNYTFWDIDTTDWDAIYREYKPKFDILAEKGFSDRDVNNQAFKMIENISSGLIDGHFSIKVFMEDTTYFYQPSFQRARQRDPDRMQFDFTQLWEKALFSFGPKRFTRFRYDQYPLDEDGYITDYNYVGIAAGILDNDLIYFRLGNFLLQEHYGTGDNIDQTITRYHDLLDNYPNVKGIIIDLRDNPGGYIKDLQIILGKLVSEEHVWCYIRGKNGYGRYDYSPWTPEIIKPMEHKRLLDVPIVVLADMYSASMSEIIVLAVRSLPNSCFIGERTYGANGCIYTNFEMFYSGYFKNDVYETYTSMTTMKDLNGVNHEGIGISPDIEVPYDAEGLAAGIDRQLDKAVEYIRSLQE